METSLDELLNEVEGAITRDTAGRYGGRLRTGVTRDWSSPPAFKPPASPLEPSQSSFSTMGRTSVHESRKTVLNSSVAMASFKGTAEGESASRKDVGDDVDVDELLRVVSAIGGEDHRGSSSCFVGKKGHTPREIVAGEDAVVSSHGTSPTAAVDVEGGIKGDGTAVGTKKRRCGTIYLAGMTAPRGYCASSMSKYACDRLRCTECNFEVLCFGHQIWEPNTDYIFLRNNAPDPSKLSARLRPSPVLLAKRRGCADPVASGAAPVGMQGALLDIRQSDGTIDISQPALEDSGIRSGNRNESHHALPAARSDKSALTSRRD